MLHARGDARAQRADHAGDCAARSTTAGRRRGRGLPAVLVALCCVLAALALLAAARAHASDPPVSSPRLDLPVPPPAPALPALPAVPELPGPPALPAPPQAPDPSAPGPSPTPAPGAPPVTAGPPEPSSLARTADPAVSRSPAPTRSQPDVPAARRPARAAPGASVGRGSARGTSDPRGADGEPTVAGARRDPPAAPDARGAETLDVRRVERLADAARRAPRATTTPAGRPSLPKRAVNRAIDSIPLPVPDEVKALILALVLLAIVLGAHSLLIAGRARRLERQRAALLEDVGLLQQALLPAVGEQVGALRISVAYRPASGPGAGGDFYDAFPLPGGRVGIIVGDVCGHGREALRGTALVHYTLRAYLQADLEPRAALRTAGHVLDSGDAEPTTVVVAVHDPADGSLTYAAAGHPAPILVGATAHEPVTAGASPPLGAGLPTGRRQTTVSLPAGSLACFFTDGLIEARFGAERLGRDRLAAMVAELGEDAGAAALLERVSAQAGEVSDDMAACIVRAESGAGLPRPRIEELEVDAAGARRPAVSSFLAQCGLADHEREVALERLQATADESGGALIRVLVGQGRAAGRFQVAPPTAVSIDTPALPGQPVAVTAPAR